VLRRKEIFNSKGKTTEYDAKVQALVTILDAYGLLEELSYMEIHNLMHDLIKLLFM
jgi:hypothetical protein